MFKSINNFTANVVKRQHTHNICARKDVEKLKKLTKQKKATDAITRQRPNFQLSIVNFLLTLIGVAWGKAML